MENTYFVIFLIVVDQFSVLILLSTAQKNDHVPTAAVVTVSCKSGDEILKAICVVW